MRNHRVLSPLDDLADRDAELPQPFQKASAGSRVCSRHGAPRCSFLSAISGGTNAGLLLVWPIPRVAALGEIGSISIQAESR
ncbi:hypothetical protein VTL71DRAFT_12425, partial [Oculimacula yallundae]